MRVIDYSQIRTAYVMGKCNKQGHHEYPTLAQLAKEHGLSLSTLTHRAASEGWNKQRQQSEERIMLAAIAQYEDEMAAKLAYVDKLASDAAAAMLQVIVESLEQAETKQERQALTTKYAKILPDLLSTAHNAIGVEFKLNELEGLQEQIEKRGAA
jgi:hypothetical protein